MQYDGPLADALPVKDFLESQVRAARHSTLNAAFDVTVADTGLPLNGEEPEKLAERLTRFVTGAAWVEAVPAREER